MKPTPAMIGAAHDVTMKEAGIILSHAQPSSAAAPGEAARTPVQQREKKEPPSC